MKVMRWRMQIIVMVIGVADFRKYLHGHESYTPKYEKMHFKYNYNCAEKMLTCVRKINWTKNGNIILSLIFKVATNRSNVIFDRKCFCFSQTFLKNVFTGSNVTDRNLRKLAMVVLVCPISFMFIWTDRTHFLNS